MTSSTSPRRQRPVPAARAGRGATWIVYILRCADGTLYTGCTNDLARRLRAHGRGEVKYTRGRLPVEPIHQEQAVDRARAQVREAEIKRMPRKAKLALPARSGM